MLFFGLITVYLVAVPDEAELEKKRRRRQRRAPKNRCEWILQRIRFHLIRRLLLLLLSVLFLFGYLFVKLWMKKFILKVGVISYDVRTATIAFIGNLFS